jgi:predicted nucleic acid-binding protein
LQSTVLDSYAVLALLFDEPGAQVVEALLAQAAEEDTELLMSAVNWAEVLYRVKRVQGREGVEIAREFEVSMPLEIVTADRMLAEKAADIKADCSVSLADAFSAALAMQTNAVLVTGDPEFRQLEKQVKIAWLAPKRGRRGRL